MYTDHALGCLVPTTIKKQNQADSSILGLKDEPGYANLGRFSKDGGVSRLGRFCPALCVQKHLSGLCPNGSISHWVQGQLVLCLVSPNCFYQRTTVRERFRRLLGKLHKLSHFSQKTDFSIHMSLHALMKTLALFLLFQLYGSVSVCFTIVFCTCSIIC